MTRIQKKSLLNSIISRTRLNECSKHHMKKKQRNESFNIYDKRFRQLNTQSDFRSKSIIKMKQRNFNDHVQNKFKKQRQEKINTIR